MPKATLERLVKPLEQRQAHIEKLLLVGSQRATVPRCRRRRPTTKARRSRASTIAVTAEVIAAFSASLPLRPDAARVRHVLAAAFIAHTDKLWPAGTD